MSIIIEQLIVTLDCCKGTYTVDFEKPIVISAETSRHEFICPNCGKTLLLHLTQNGRMVNIWQEVPEAG